MNQSHEFSIARDFQICREVMNRASKNYSLAAKLLPRSKRPYVEALYAFLRVGDDLVDVNHNGFASPLDAIDNWESTYWSALETGSSTHPVMRSLLHTMRKFELPDDLMAPYFRAMKEDLTITRFPHFSDLIHYMEGSSLVVGRGMTYILGIRPAFEMTQVIPFADALSIAMQLSNFIRDVEEDWDRGRVYLPQEDLKKFGVSEEDIRTRHFTPGIRELIKFEIDRTMSYFNAAQKGIEMLASGRWGVRSALEIYRAILTELKVRGYNVFSGRASANKAKKILLIMKSALMV
jgi:phytoene synthase